MSSTTRRLPSVVTSVAAVVVLLSACGSPADGDATGGDAGSSGEEAGDRSPLESLFGFDENSQRLVEDAIASCMRDRGWEYTPRPPLSNEAMTADFGTADFTAEYGYGISTEPPMGAISASTGVGGDDDPNGAYQKTLSSADLDRYFADLYGAPVTAASGDSTAAVSMGELDPNACVTTAQEEAAKENPALSSEFNQRVGELLGRLEDDPRAVEAQGKWSSCMADAGFVYERQSDVFNDLSQRYSEIRGTGGAPGAGGTGVGIEVGAPGSTVPLSPADAERLAKLQDEERAIAKADSECAAKHLAQVQEELELEVYETLKSEFPGLGAES